MAIRFDWTPGTWPRRFLSMTVMPVAFDSPAWRTWARYWPSVCAGPPGVPADGLVTVRVTPEGADVTSVVTVPAGTANEPAVRATANSGSDDPPVSMMPPSVKAYWLVPSPTTKPGEMTKPTVPVNTTKTAVFDALKAVLPWPI